MRPEIVAFAELMEQILQQNDWKAQYGDWHDCSPEYLSRKLTEEFSELQRVLIYRLKEGQTAFAEIPVHSRIILEREAADVANICMMIAHLCRNPPKPQVCQGCEDCGTECGHTPSECVREMGDVA